MSVFVKITKRMNKTNLDLALFHFLRNSIGHQTPNKFLQHVIISTNGNPVFSESANGSSGILLYLIPFHVSNQRRGQKTMKSFLSLIFLAVKFSNFFDELFGKDLKH